MSENNILIVDDSEINRSVLADILSEDFHVIEVSNGLEAVALLNKEKENINLVLLNILMPRLDGFGVLSRMNRTGLINFVPVITIVDDESPDLVDHAYDLGAIEYIAKPFDSKTIRQRVRNAVMLYTKQKNLENMVLQQMLQREKSNLLMAELLSHIVEFRNGESGLHVLNIRIITDMLLRKLTSVTDKYDLTPAKIGLITNAAILHDIGKISIADSILNKPGKLTKEEFEIMKTHSLIGAQMLESTTYYKTEELVKEARNICRWHHERYDGNGYPDGLKGEEIPISAQVVSVADVYDALSHKRVYKPAYSHKETIDMILRGECGAFNPILLKCLEDISDDLENKIHLHATDTLGNAELLFNTRNYLNKSDRTGRTLTLLEQEKEKNEFFATMTNEIQFEYATDSDVLVLSKYGAIVMGVPEVISNPRENTKLTETISTECIKDIIERLHKVEDETSVIQEIYLFKIKGKKRWYKIVARPLWEDKTCCKLSGIIGKFMDVHDEEESRLKLVEEATSDQLTRLQNRFFAKEEIIKKLDKAKETDKFSLLLIDIDNFKRANEKGHLFGDAVLIDFALSINKLINGKEILAARVGGDEFLLFINNHDVLDDFIPNLVNTLKGNYKDYEINIHIGISVFPDNGKNYNQLFFNADKALYAAKHSTDKQLCYYNDSMKNLLSMLSPVEE